MIACGALATPIRHLVERRAWAVDVFPLPALLHNRPQLIAPRVEALASRLRSQGHRVVVAYADCGTYGALDEVCERLGLHRLRGDHCFDLFAGADALSALFSDEPGTYLLTDFLVTTFRSTVVKELGLDAHPELWGDYFRHYRRVLWLAQDRTPEREAEARAVAARFDLPLEILDVGTGSLERELEVLLGPSIIGHKGSIAEVEAGLRA